MQNENIIGSSRPCGSFQSRVVKKNKGGNTGVKWGVLKSIWSGNSRDWQSPTFQYPYKVKSNPCEVPRKIQVLFHVSTWVQGRDVLDINAYKFVMLLITKTVTWRFMWSNNCQYPYKVKSNHCDVERGESCFVACSYLGTKKRRLRRECIHTCHNKWAWLWLFHTNCAVFLCQCKIGLASNASALAD